MEFFKQTTNIDFMGARKWTALLSLLLFAFSLMALLVNGLHFGLDFTGGMQIELHYQQPADLTQIRNQLAQAQFSDAVVQSYGTAEDIIVNVGLREGVDQEQLIQQITQALPGATQRRVDFVGPQVGKELATKGMLAILVALLGTMIYIALRFEYRFAISSAVALIHDPILILGIFALLRIEFDLKALAALLAVIGYSLNDTIVVFDRVRENFRNMRKASPVEVMNAAINQTLSRTIMTSASTLVVVLALFFYGGELIHGFALAFLIGIVIGTYSSIYVAGALAIAMGLSRKDLIAVPKAELDDMP
ncbi:MAG: protein translocase subunit SecF [Gammaproteobacteria bacterium]